MTIFDKYVNINPILKGLYYMKNIAWDVDGVLTDLSEFQLTVGEKYFKKKYNMDIVDPKGSSIKKIFNCTDKEEYEFWRDNIIYYATKWPIRPGASEIINKLTNDGCNNFILTSRIKTDEKTMVGLLMRSLLKIWLLKNKINIKPNQFHFCSIKNSAEEKSKFCKEHNIDYVIDDDTLNVKSLKEETNTFKFSNVYNEEKIDGVTDVKYFYELYENILKDNGSFRFLKKAERDELTHEELVDYYKNLKESYIKNKPLTNIDFTEKFYHFVYPGLSKLFNLKYPHILDEKASLPKENGVIYVANHRDMIDPPLIMSVLGNRPVHLLLKAEFLNTPFKSFLKSLGCVFVHRGNRDSEILSSEELSKILLNGGNVIIFPEGTRNKTNETLLDFKTGAVSIAQRTGAPIVPIAITKKFDDYSEKILIKTGEKMYVDYFDDICEKNRELRCKIEDMLLDENKSKVKKKTI